MQISLNAIEVLILGRVGIQLYYFPLCFTRSFITRRLYYELFIGKFCFFFFVGDKNLALFARFVYSLNSIHFAEHIYESRIIL